MLYFLREWLAQLWFPHPDLLNLANDLNFFSLRFTLDFEVFTLKLLNTEYQGLQVSLHLSVLILQDPRFLNKPYFFIHGLHIEQF